MIPRVLKRLTALGAAFLVLVLPTTAAAAGLTRAEARLLRDLNRVRARRTGSPRCVTTRISNEQRARIHATCS